MRFLVQSREQFEHNTDPQRRCYNGCHARSEWVWSAWCTLSIWPTEVEARESAERWRHYNRDVKTRRLEYRYTEEPT